LELFLDFQADPMDDIDIAIAQMEAEFDEDDRIQIPLGYAEPGTVDEVAIRPDEYDRAGDEVAILADECDRAGDEVAILADECDRAGDGDGVAYLKNAGAIAPVTSPQSPVPSSQFPLRNEVSYLFNSSDRDRDRILTPHFLTATLPPRGVGKKL